jgi:hypothetical protein
MSKGDEMTYREARTGAAIAGAALLSIPTIEVLYGMGSPGPVHFLVGSFGLALVLVAGRFR